MCDGIAVEFITICIVDTCDHRAVEFSHYLDMCDHRAVEFIFCLHYTTKLTQRLRHGRVGQPGPRYILIVTMNLQQSG